MAETQKPNINIALLGDVAGTQSFYPFGEVRAGTGIFDTERGFTGQIFDGGSGLGF